MAAEELVVYARFKAYPGKEEEAAKELTSLLGPTRMESGCKYYVCHGVKETPGEFIFYEIWESRAALDAHMQTPHLQDLLSKVDALFAEAPEIKFLQKLS